MGHGGDVIEELTADHREVDELFDRTEAVPARGSERRRLLDQLTIELVRHAVAEEQHRIRRCESTSQAAMRWPIRRSPTTAVSSGF